MQRFSIWAAALVLAVAALTPTQRASAQGYVVVVNEEGPPTLSRDEMSRAFLKKSSRLTPVDQLKDSRARIAFSKAIIGRPVTAVMSYWQQQIFSGGESPPGEKGSDAEVLAFVRANPRAIGYVTAGADLGTGVRAIALP